MFKFPDYIDSDDLIDKYAQCCVDDMPTEVLMNVVKEVIEERLRGGSDEEIFDEIENSPYSSLLLKNVSVISGTMRSQDLIPAFLDVLRMHDTEWYCAHITRVWPMPPSYALEDDDDEWWDSEQCSYFLNEELFDRLNDIAPEGYFFGSHPGNGSDYGFWEVEDE